jgi:23S rRNA pseudouridine2605 synthase
MSNTGDEKPMRLQRYLAAAGVSSRRKSEELITTGHVQVDGEVVTKLGTQVVPGKNEVRVDTEIVKLKPKVYYLLNKPSGVVCTHEDPSGRPRAIDLIPHNRAVDHLFTVGRLDENSEGLLIVTNDGELTNRMTHPKFRVLRTYRVLVAGDPDYSAIKQLQDGLYFREGRFKVHHVKKLKKQGRSTMLELQLSEGQNREVRRLLARIGHKVMTLTRVGFGPIKLGTLASGEYRILTHKEANDLLEFAFSKPGNEPRGQEKHRVRPRRQRKSNSKNSTRRK